MFVEGAGGRVFVPLAEYDATLGTLCETGDAYARLAFHDAPRGPIRWDDGEPWRLELRIALADGGHRLTGALIRGGQSISLAEPRVLHPAALVLVSDTLARFDHGGAWLVAMTLRRFDIVPLVDGELTELLASIHKHRHPPIVRLDPRIPIAERQGTPRPWLTIATDADPTSFAPATVKLAFEYADVPVEEGSPADTVFDPVQLELLRRDRAAERAARERLVAAGIDGPTIPRARIASLVVELVREGWRVDASGVRYRSPGMARATVSSGIDWFDLDLEMDFGGVSAPLPALLDALRRRQSTVALADGSVGFLPTEWLARIGPALAAGSTGAARATTRFNRAQVELLDALISTMPVVSVDETFARARERIQAFDGIVAADPSPTFTGTLRAYQREGLGWLHFLRDFRLGGCLADDMGLGKTVQVLALLEERVARGDAQGCTLIVVPRSLVFNWVREIERFAPRLRVLDYSVARRDVADLADHDVAVTTYAVVRGDIEELSKVQFDYVILDEAQAIKNPQTISAHAARALRARHRLALTGTPIENRVEELWSLFEFLNPGMLGSATTFSRLAHLAVEPLSGDDEDAAAGRDLLRRALRPVILRRTKAEVAPELPERCEETLYVDMEPAQRDFYLGLLAATRASVFDVVDRDGISRSQFHILEALLRLRQAACHPALVDHSRIDLPSAKLDALVPTLAEIVEEGHKAVVFSQFTSFLSIVRRRLDDAGLAYEYLDGGTRDRAARVTHFQAEDGPPVFLISLKAGGHGLNLTAADYVYLLDPWWNPAVEAQAIDRAHRIGQTRPVIATRLVARGTVEEKVLELQASKRDLADAILNADQGALGRIGREELELLLG